MTLVSVITPTWERHGPLLGRCVPSVLAQTHQPVEHVVVSDGPDPELRGKLFALGYGSAGWPERRYVEVPVHDAGHGWGSRGRLAGLEVASGELVAYLDDDNAWRPDHLKLLVAALDAAPDARFAYSRMLRHWGAGAADEVGLAPPCYGQVDTSLLCHRRDLVEVATWRTAWPGHIDQHAPDWDLVDRWLAAGVGWAHVEQVTVDYYL